MMAQMVVVLDEDRDVRFEVSGQEEVLQQNSVFSVNYQRSIFP